MLLGRRSECDVLDELIDAVSAGEGRALVIHGEAGIGKTAPLEYAAEKAENLRVEHASGVDWEMMDLAFAGLHQLCTQISTASSGCRTSNARRSRPLLA